MSEPEQVTIRNSMPNILANEAYGPDWKRTQDVMGGQHSRWHLDAPALHRDDHRYRRHTHRRRHQDRNQTDFRPAMTKGRNDAEPAFSDRIEAEIHRGMIDSPAAEEAAQLEGWMTHGAPTPGTPAQRFKDKAEE